MSSHKSLQERIVSEIESTYNSLENYKNTTNHRVELIEHKLKSLKMMLAKVDDSNHIKCSKCTAPVLINTILKNPANILCKKCAN